MKIKRETELPLPYFTIDPLIDESARMEAFVDLADLHDDPHREHYIIKLIQHVAKHPTLEGYIGEISNRTLARKCRWQGDPDFFAACLLQSGWIENTENGRRLEGWERHGGRVLKERMRWRESKRKHASKETPAGIPRESTGSTPGTPAGLPPLKGEGRRVNLKGEPEPENYDRESGEGEKIVGGKNGRALPASFCPRDYIDDTPTIDQIEQYVGNQGGPMFAPDHQLPRLRQYPPTWRDVVCALDKARNGDGKVKWPYFWGTVVGMAREAAEQQSTPKKRPRGRETSDEEWTRLAAECEAKEGKHA